ncbi:TIGR03084 family metal-binding protein [Ramlibacter tataouinensis]|uniref:TIGR03084 family metal-binding protein n=1 Tax=Ramlibacter tataouinensis TaxID=94132 RepID=UPI0022F3EF43|nr:TIGR03084 family metal-binding protein [Ramlibacter tataouinensis]WBY02340.1 TIGR03084 family metal-binding protein [Ramlibacter tataouinensis]
MTMQELGRDLLAEYDELGGLVEGFTPPQWELPTGFFHWTPWDEIAHLMYFDQASLQALTEPQAFAVHARDLMARMARGEHMSLMCRELYRPLDGAALVRQWRPLYRELVQRLSVLDPKDRLPWYGPSMSARSFATARLMECWAHGQDVWDAVRRRRPVHARLRHIAHLGVSTFGWSFAVRGQPPPGPQPFVELEGPGGGRWSWGEPGSSDAIRGPAADFCAVVTQRRHVQDTQLQVTGATAAAWMAVAQCFAGEPATGPAPGVRKVEYGA